MEGWIKLYRKIAENPLWLIKPFSRGQAWIDLLILANHKPGFFYVRDVKVKVERGQVGWSEPKLSERWGWSRTKVRKFLKDLAEEQQIVLGKKSVTQIITILNFDECQKKEQQEIHQPIPQDGQQQDSSRTAAEQQQDPNKNDKNIKNDKNSLFRQRFFSVLEIFYFKNFKNPIAVTNAFFNHYEGVGWKNAHGLEIENVESVAENWDNKTTEGINCPENLLLKWKVMFGILKNNTEHYNKFLRIRPARIENGILFVRAKQNDMKLIEDDKKLLGVWKIALLKSFGKIDIKYEIDKQLV
ncbi:hypothetical protein SLH46_18410 [Draconibacterium sp. IB214405]|uniref:hypothetical protein n=1 Tax=Draconibacterium sp. IB214405 TaxID=3097352 RepID=UPI002A12B140|nr:hypothetical protein [Draconibacterium sp. IB214405]MDX8341178.1 hypothetical protein [Draconibacterium sp. IB214405]